MGVGKSEGRPVMGRIRVAPDWQHHPTRKRADFPAVSRHENHGGIDTEGVANDGGLFHWCYLPRKGIDFCASIVQPAGCMTADGSLHTAFEMLELDEGKLCAAGRGAESLTQSRGVRRETPGSSTDLKAKAGGDKSMSEKRETREGVYRVVLRDPRDRVRAALPESQSPAVELHTRRYHAWHAAPS